MPCFESGLGEHPIQEFIMTGHYAFAEYAIAYWSEHLLSAVWPLDAPDTESLAHIIEVFLKLHFSPTLSTQPVPKPIERAIEKFQPCAFYDSLGQAIALLENRKRSNSKAENFINNLDFEDVLSRIRSLMEKMSSSEKTKESLERIHGPKIFKCSRIDCTSFVEGFSNLDDCRQHQKKHDRLFHCTFEGCVAARSGFTSSTELQRHFQRLHNPSVVPGFPCYQKPNYRVARRAIKEVNIPVIERYLQIQCPKDSLMFSKGRFPWRRFWQTAIRHPDNEVFNLLIRHTEFQGTNTQHIILEYATAARQTDLVRRFVGDEFRKADTTGTVECTRAIAAAISLNDVVILRILMGPDLSKISPPGLLKAQNHLADACKSGSFSCVRYLVSECGLDPFKHENLHSNLAKGRHKQVSKEPRWHGPFYNAIAAGHKSIVEHLLSLVDDQRYFKPQKSEDFLTAAAINGHKEILEILVNHKLAVEKLMAKRYTVIANLYNAVRYGNEELVKELLPLAGPDYDMPDRNGCSMLMYAALNGLEYTVEYLLRKQADVTRAGHCPEVTATTSWHQTALILATFNGHTHIVRRLLQCPGIQVLGFVKFRKGQKGFRRSYDPIEVAELKGYTTISQLLRDHRAHIQTAGVPSQNQHPPGASTDVSLTEKSGASDRNDQGNLSDEELFAAGSKSSDDETEPESPGSSEGK